MSDERAAVTTEEFAEAFQRYHGGNYPAVPARVVLDGQEWDDLDGELEDLARPVAELRGVDRYVREPAGMPRADELAWVHHPGVAWVPWPTSPGWWCRSTPHEPAPHPVQACGNEAIGLVVYAIGEVESFIHEPHEGWLFTPLGPMPEAPRR